MPYKKKATRVENVAQAIAIDIRKGNYASGQRLPSERDMAETLNISRPVYREAAKLLESQGLVEIVHGRGISITDKLHLPIQKSILWATPDPKTRLKQAVQARAIIEPAIAELAAELITEDQIAELDALQESYAKTTEAEALVEIDLRFHTVISKACGNEILRLMLDSMHDLNIKSRAISLNRTDRLEVLKQHLAIIKAMKARSPRKAANAMKRHIDYATQAL